MGITFDQNQTAVRRDLAKLLDVARQGASAGLHDAAEKLQGASALLVFSRTWHRFEEDIISVAKTIIQDEVDLETLANRWKADDSSNYHTSPRDVFAVVELLLTARWLLSQRWEIGMDLEDLTRENFNAALEEIEDLPGRNWRQAKRLMESCYVVMRAMGSCGVYMANPDLEGSGSWLADWQE